MACPDQTLPISLFAQRNAFRYLMKTCNVSSRQAHCQEVGYRSAAMAAGRCEGWRRFISALAAGTLVAGCTPLVVTDVSSSHYRLPATTTVIIRETITVPPGTAHVTLQDGQIVELGQLRRYEPFCEIEVNDVVDIEQRIHPGRFVATHIIRRQELGAKHPRALLAANTVTASESDTANAAWTLAALDDTLRLNQVHLRLQSAAQPNVRELRCAGGWAFTSTVAYPTLAEMKRALGVLLSIEIN